MDLQQFEILENKISQAISAIQKLKQENRELEKRLQALREENQEKDKMLGALQEEIQKLKDNTQESQQFKTREEEIRSKVEKMLAKLEELQLQY
jgi:FtsZ-binding cell division protein ZapB